MKLVNLKTRNLFFSIFLLLLLQLQLFPPDVKAQDTTYFSAVSHDVGVSKTVSFTKDSTKATVTNWMDFTSYENKYVYLSNTFLDSSYGRSAGNDTLRCIVQGKDDAGNILNIDTVGSGSSGAEIIVSAGTPAQYLITPKNHLPLLRLYYEAVRTYGAKNGRGHYAGSLYGIPK